jgi:hypothetical protein
MAPTARLCSICCVAAMARASLTCVFVALTAASCSSANTDLYTADRGEGADPSPSSSASTTPSPGSIIEVPGGLPDGSSPNVPSGTDTSCAGETVKAELIPLAGC